MLKSRVSQNVSCMNCSVNNLCLTRHLMVNEVAEVNELITKIKIVSKGQNIFLADDKMSYLYAVYKGLCKDYWFDENGVERIGNFYLRGDIIGLESLPNKKHLSSLIALEDTELCIIPIEPLLELMQKNSNFLKRFLHITSYKMQNDQRISITTNANQRVADFILTIFYRLRERNMCNEYINLPMSQLDISHFLGMAHETVNRILRKFQDSNIIQIEHKKIRIVDIGRLKELGTEIRNFHQE